MILKDVKSLEENYENKKPKLMSELEIPQPLIPSQEREDHLEQYS